MATPIQRFTPRELRADEIQVRKGNYIGEDKSRVELLLYIDARAGMNILDETVGEYGWTCNYQMMDGILFCGIGIKDPITGQFVWKWDAGGDNNIEPDKSKASSSYKRALSRFGIGRSLYTAPRIVVPNEPTGYKCTDIEYEDHKIVRLTIVDSRGDLVFKMDENGTSVRGSEPKSSLPEENKELPWSARLADWCGKAKALNEDPDYQLNLLAFFYHVLNQTQRGERWGIRALWKFFRDDIKAGKLEIDDTNPKRPKVVKKGGE